MKKKVIIAVALALLAGGGAGFFGGMKYQQSQATASRMGNFAGRNGPVRNGGNFRPVSGEIISTDDKSITVKMADGSSRIVLFSGLMTISKSADASKSDLTVGAKVAVFGMQNSDGSVTAQNIQLNPVIRATPSPAPNQ